jgi:hypothetical protein
VEVLAAVEVEPVEDGEAGFSPVHLWYWLDATVPVSSLRRLGVSHSLVANLATRGIGPEDSAGIGIGAQHGAGGRREHV